MDPGTLSILSDMIEKLAAIPIAIIVVGLPCFVVLRVSQLRAGTRLHAADQAALQNVNADLRQMKLRMAALERILDAEAPAWRSTYETSGETYGQQAG